MSRPHHKTPIIIIVVSRGNYFYWLNCLNSPREEGYLDCYCRILLFFHGKHVGNVDNSGMNKKTITVQCFLCCFFFFLVGSQCFCFFLLSKAIAYHIKTSICLCNNDLSNPSNYDKHNNLQPSLLVAPWETFHAFCGLSADFFF